MYNTIICAIVVVMLASTVVVAKPRNNQTNGQTRLENSIAGNWSARKKGKARLAKPPPCDRR
jgi:hypothetical protein